MGKRFIVVVLFWLAAVLPAWSESRLALVVGNSAYEHVGELINPTNDALDISVALEGLGFDVIVGMDLSLEQMRDVVVDFGARAKTADVVLFYYAGHGFQVSGENYLVSVDSKLSGIGDLQSQTTPMNAVLTAMENSPGLKLVFLDACRDNPFGAELPGGKEGIARAGTAEDFLFAYATQPDNVAYDGIRRNSFFTEALLSHIYAPGQTIAELLISVRRDVLSATGGRQIPWENSSLTRQFSFDQGPPAGSQETLLWQVAASEQSLDLMQLYIDRYPEGAHRNDVLAFIETGQGRTLDPVDAGDAEERLWNLARRSRMRPLLQYYLERFPDGTNHVEAERLLALIPDVEDYSAGRICERLATHPRDATASQAGVSFEALRGNAVPAMRACAAAAAQSPDLPHYTALFARATAAAGDINRAVTLYQTAAARGDLRAMVSLAQLTETGNGLPADPAAALELYERAAANGSADAMINLAVIILERDRGPDGIDRAVSLLSRAAGFGSAKATFNLGVLAQDGLFDPPEDALGYFQQAAKDGEVQGYRAAAILLDEGRTVTKDPAYAADMILRAVASDNGLMLDELTNRTGQWSRDTIGAVQGRLAEAGHYTAAIDGYAGPRFTEALTIWRNGGFKPEVLRN